MKTNTSVPDILSIQPGYACGLSLLMAMIALFFSMSTGAHEQSHQDKHEPLANAAGRGDHFQVFDSETLRVPNVPVTDTDYRTEGFVTRFAGKESILIGFTYTDCETLCPISHMILKQVDTALAESDAPDIHVVTLSIDPETDTPAVLGVAAEQLGASDRWTFLSSSVRENRTLLDALGVEVGTLDEHDPMFLVGNVRTGRFVRFIGIPDPGALIAIGAAGD